MENKNQSNKNYSSTNIGKLDNLRDNIIHLPNGNDIVGKIFIGEQLGLSGAEISFQIFEPAESSPFLHFHTTHEEVYIFLKGNGEFQVDGDIFPISEGSIVKVDMPGLRAIRNTGSTPLIMICAQYKANSFNSGVDTPIGDGRISSQPVTWK